MNFGFLQNNAFHHDAHEHGHYCIGESFVFRFTKENLSCGL